MIPTPLGTLTSLSFFNSPFPLVQSALTYIYLNIPSFSLFPSTLTPPSLLSWLVSIHFSPLAPLPQQDLTGSITIRDKRLQ